MSARTFGSSRGTAPEFHLVIAALAIASVIELAILRTFTRTAIHIPAIDLLKGPYRVLSLGGEYAYFVSVALVIPALAWLGWAMLRSGTPGRLVGVYGLGIFAFAGTVAAVGGSGLAVVGTATVIAVAMLCGAFALSTASLRSAVPIISLGVAFSLAGAYTVIPALASDGLRLSQPAWFLDGAEWAGLAFAISTPFIFGQRFERKAKVAGLIAFALVLLIFLGNGASSRFLLLWNVGLAGTLPGVFYAAAAGILVATTVALASAERWLAAAGIVLLVCGGIGLHSTYQSALVVIGLATICYASRLLPVPGTSQDGRSPGVLSD